MVTDAANRIQALQRIPLLAGLPYGDLEDMAARIEEQQFVRGSELIKEGTSGSSVFLLVSGRCEVRRKTPSGTVRLALLEPGDFFGELSILTPLPRTATVTAFDDVEAMVLTGFQFQTALRSNRAMADHLIKVLATRLRNLEDEFINRLRT